MTLLFQKTPDNDKFKRKAAYLTKGSSVTQEQMSDAHDSEWVGIPVLRTQNWHWLSERLSLNDNMPCVGRQCTECKICEVVFVGVE